MSREKLFELIEDGNLDPMMAVTMCAKWMTDDEVAKMLDANELSERFEEDKEEGEVTWQKLKLGLLSLALVLT